MDTFEVKVMTAVARQAGVPFANVRPDSFLREDLKLDSLDLVELEIELQDTFAIRPRGGDLFDDYVQCATVHQLIQATRKAVDKTTTSC